MNPYYQHAGITIYHGDCRDILPTLEKADLVLTDPPYGISLPCNFNTRKRGGLSECRIDYPPIHDDDKPFDPSHILGLDLPTVLFGGNYFADKLPPSSGWFVWDKFRPDALDQSTAELAWTNFVKGVRVFRHLWNGMMVASEKGEHYHPSQKPVALFTFILTHRWTPSGTVLDPYCGAGPCLVAAKHLGREAIGIEIEERYCEIAAKRLSQEVLCLS